MKQLLQNTKSGTIEIQELPPPRCHPGGILVKSYYSVISAGTESQSVSTAKASLVGKANSRPDLVQKVVQSVQSNGLKNTYDMVKNRLNSQMELGYSCSGQVVEVGSDVSEFQLHDSVACAGGGFASHSEFNYIPNNLAIKIPENVSYKNSAYTTLGSIALQGIRQSGATVGDTVAVIGLGLIGMLTVQILKAGGCRVIGLDIAEFPIEKATGDDIWSLDMGLNSNDPTNIDAVKSFTNGYGVDQVIITAGSKSNDPIIISGEILRDRGTLVVVGAVPVDVPRSPFYEKEIEIKFSRSYGPGRYDRTYEEKGIDYPIGYVRWTERRNMDAFLRLISDGRINPSAITTHIFSLQDAPKAYDMILKHSEPYLGILIKYDNTDNSMKTTFQNTVSISPTDRPISIGFIGLGKFAQSFLLSHLKNKTSVILHTVSNSTGTSSNTMMQRFGFTQCTTDSDTIFNSEEINTVFITSRHDTHAEYLIKAIQHNKHVFIEKPIVINRDELKDIKSSILNLQSSILMVGYNRRFAPVTTKLVEKLKSHNRSISINYRINAGKIPIDHWIQDKESGGGRIVGEVCHFVDYAIYLTGSEVINVFASSISNSDVSIPNEDSVHIQLMFKNGSIATIQYLCDGSRKVEKEWIEVTGDGKMYQVNDFKKGIQYSGSKKETFYTGKQNKGYKNEIDSFINAILSTHEHPININEIIHGMDVSFAILESLRKQKVIQIN